MLSGFNTNFRYRGVLFHVQTEDSGRDNPHVITHLFHGGNIMASYKRDYSTLLGESDVEGSVRKLMEAQHKTMLKQLSRGEHDAVIAQRLGSDIFKADVDSQVRPANVTEEELPPAQPLIDEPPLVLAEHTHIGAEAVLSNSFGAESILEPEFATELPPMTSTSEPASSSEASPPESEAQPTSDRDASTSSDTSGSRQTAPLVRVFGERVVSEKPLDEVVLDYLVDNARKNARNRKRQPK